MTQTATQEFGEICLPRRQRTYEEQCAETKLFQTLQPHTETYGLTIETNTWFDGERICSVAFLKADPQDGPYCITTVVQQIDGTLREWPRDRNGGPIADSQVFHEEVLHKIIDDAISGYTAS